MLPLQTASTKMSPKTNQTSRPHIATVCYEKTKAVKIQTALQLAEHLPPASLGKTRCHAVVCRGYLVACCNTRQHNALLHTSNGTAHSSLWGAFKKFCTSNIQKNTNVTNYTLFFNIISTEFKAFATFSTKLEIFCLSLQTASLSISSSW